MDAQLLVRYADLIVSVGANVQPDQVLAVEALPEAQPLVAEIARRAYEKGARYVDVQYFDGDVKRIRAERAPDGTLDWVPPWLGRRMVALGELDYFVVCCPKDVTMYEDAIKTSGHQGEIELRELTELVWESLGRSAEGGRNGKEQQV